MFLKQIRLSNQAKEQLARLKAKTGIQNWNVLCRWALCLSLREPSIPPNRDIPADSNVEMTWYVFGGEYHEIYEALIRQRCIEDGLGTDPATLAKYFRLHLHRGISYLAAPNYVKSINDLLKLALQDTHLVWNQKVRLDADLESNAGVTQEPRPNLASEVTQIPAGQGSVNATSSSTSEGNT